MGKRTSDTSTDQSLLYIKNNVTRQVACSAEPSSYANVASVALADVALSSGDVTVGAGSGGREYEVASKSDVDIDATGTVNHMALVNDGSNELLDITTVPNTEVASGGTATIGSWKRTIQDPS